MLLISTQCIAAPCLGMRFSWAGLNQGKERNQHIVGGICSWKVSQTSDKMKFESLLEEPDNQVVTEIVKADHVLYFEPDFSCAIFCQTEWFLSTTNPEQPLYLQPSSGLPQTRWVPATSHQIWLWEISLPVFFITLLSYATWRWNQQLKPLGPCVSPPGLQQWEDSHVCLRSAMGSAVVMLLSRCTRSKGRITGWASKVLTKSGWEFVAGDSPRCSSSSAHHLCRETSLNPKHSIQEGKVAGESERGESLSLHYPAETHTLRVWVCFAFSTL